MCVPADRINGYYPLERTYPRLRTLALGVAFASSLMLSACVPETGELNGAGGLTTQTPAGPSTTFVETIDGDTIVTSEGTVRVVGIDAPERGECGYRAAVAVVDAHIKHGDGIELVHPPKVDDTDRYDRLLRYVDVGGDDLGLLLLESGNAVARYDSRDGYPAHPREAAYHAAQTAKLVNGKVITVECAAADGVDAPGGTVPAPTDGEWWREYSSCSKLKKNTVGHPTGPFNRNDPEQVAIYEWFVFGTGHNGDGDNNGLACE